MLPSGILLLCSRFEVFFISEVGENFWEMKICLFKLYIFITLLVFCLMFSLTLEPRYNINGGFSIFCLFKLELILHFYAKNLYEVCSFNKTCFHFSVCILSFAPGYKFTFSMLPYIFDRKVCRVKTDYYFIFKQLKVVKSFSKDSTPGSLRDKKTTIVEETDGILAPSNAEEPGCQSTKLPTRIDCHGYINLNDPDSENLSKRKVTNQSDTAQCDSRSPPDSQNSCKKLKRISDVVTVITDNSKSLHLGACDKHKHINNCAVLDKSVEHTSNKLIVPSSTCHSEHDKGVVDGPKAVTDETELKNSLNSLEEQVDGILGFSDWKPLEKELYLKGVEMFGRNRYVSFCVHLTQ